uniref:Uncharacterized protein n=1 Tax=Timema genevievae TaxID=629358 RepID=A0A7R9PNH3_TIMGE|nr:unnamed protein product [Timema genevievae]
MLQYGSGKNLVDKDNLTEVSLGKAPRKVLHFSDGTLEEYSTDEDESDIVPTTAVTNEINPNFSAVVKKGRADAKGSVGAVAPAGIGFGNPALYPKVVESSDCASDSESESGRSGDKRASSSTESSDCASDSESESGRSGDKSASSSTESSDCASDSESESGRSGDKSAISSTESNDCASDSESESGRSGDKSASGN